MTLSTRLLRPPLFSKKEPLSRMHLAFCAHFYRPFSSSSLEGLDKKAGNPIAPEEVLYLAKEAGFYTKRELQDQILRSPPFTQSKSPFLLENFLTPLPTEQEERIAISEGEDEEVDVNVAAHELVPRSIHETFRAMSQNQTPTFTDSKTGYEWLTRSDGLGTRARASAHVILTRGSGIIKVNGEEDFTSRWPLLYNRMEICLPFQETRSAGLFDVFIAVKGGGTSGQAGAASLAIARALAKARPSCVPQLEARQLLFEDRRQKLPKEAGREKARRGYAWSKR